MVEALLKSTLETQGHPVERLLYTGTPIDTYITFQVMLIQSDTAADDEITSEVYLCRVDIFTKGDFTELRDNVRAALKAAGFRGITVDPEVYEKDTHFYHVPINAKYYRKV